MMLLLHHPSQRDDGAGRGPRCDILPSAWKQGTWKRSLVLRAALAAAFVVLCHAFEWHWIRLLTTNSLMQISALLGVPMRRLGWDLVAIGAVTMRFVVSCTLVDAFPGCSSPAVAQLAGRGKKSAAFGNNRGGLFST